MPNMYSRIIIHATFSTRHRVRCIGDGMEPHLFGYLGSTINGLACTNIIVNGYRDHVHLLFHCPARLAVSDVLREIKKSSGSFVREQLGLPAFRWQSGGGAFSVDHHAIDRVLRYIERQREHHGGQGVGFEEEYRAILTENQVGIDERYLLDPLEEA
jgi:REP element-mobilizing transposase RayT